MGFFSRLFTPKKTKLTRVFLDWMAPAEARISALKQLVRMSATPTVEELIGVATESYYNNESERVRAAASQALVDLGQQAVEPLIDYLHYDVDSDYNESRRAAATRALGLIGGNQAEGALVKLLAEQQEYSKRKRLGPQGYRWVEDALLRIRKPEEAASKDRADADAKRAMERRERENTEHRMRIEACSHNWKLDDSGRLLVCSKCGYSMSYD